MSPLRRQVTIENLRGGCHGIVTHDGEQDACGKPVTVIIDGHGTEAEGFWPACTYHGNRYGGGRVVPLEVLVDVLADGGAGRGCDGLGVVWTCDNCQAVTETGLDDEPAGWLIEEPDEDDYPEGEDVPIDLLLCGDCRCPDVVTPPDLAAQPAPSGAAAEDGA